MNRLAFRLVLSHLLVALLGAGATFLIVRQIAPPLFEQSVQRRGMGSGRPDQTGATLRLEFIEAVDQALLIGALVGAGAAAAFGAFASYRLVRSLGTIRAATRAMARGRYDVPVPRPRETELAELVDDVNTLGRGLADTEARRVRLLGEVGHEMRTPLTVIDGYVEAMIDGVMPTAPEQLAQVSEEVRRLRRLSDDLSTLSRAEEGRLGLALQRVELGQVVAAAAERLRPQVEDAGLRLVVDVEPARTEVMADADRVAQLVTNLVGNAIRATDPGGEVRVSCRPDGESVVVEVADTGEGLDPAELEHIFERFYRVPGRRVGEHETGSGIGLTIARGIVREHGGQLTGTSPGRGRGATFTARLPAAGAADRP
ncbi:HAMP domain-containing sensor histidine kinase [Intrasporangium sp.]|uniref:sensor histidine kinase n=1 Tax=Intrasporangium sp. TaxID=1925024 RepID=UPI00293B4555|nr:HAMP domain-containing sensor histidine kinase [Intrasporangium sp.]MDV3221466.1 HAMP domain-containing histidine kinase [Intrasporangium sp.]